MENELIKVELIMREMRERRMEPSFKYPPDFEVLGNRWTEGRKKGGTKKKTKTHFKGIYSATV